MLIALWFPVCEICFDYTNFALELNTLKFELWEHIEPNKKALWLISWYIMNISPRLALPTLPICNANICLCSMSSSPLSAVDWLCSIGLAIRKSLELVYRLVKSFAVWNNVEKWNGMGKVDTIHPRQWIPPSLLSAEFYGISFGFKMKHFTFVSIFDVFEALLNWRGWSEDHHITSHHIALPINTSIWNGRSWRQTVIKLFMRLWFHAFDVPWLNPPERFSSFHFNRKGEMDETEIGGIQTD